jgi:hypothetical protein
LKSFIARNCNLKNIILKDGDGDFFYLYNTVGPSLVVNLTGNIFTHLETAYTENAKLTFINAVMQTISNKGIITII